MHIEVGLIAYSGLVVGSFFAVAMFIGAFGLNNALSDDMKVSRDRVAQDPASSRFRATSSFAGESDDWRNAA